MRKQTRIPSIFRKVVLSLRFSHAVMLVERENVPNVVSSSCGWSEGEIIIEKKLSLS